jgi:DNA invertase Pin-like site-specific DNA recombinase
MRIFSYIRVSGKGQVGGEGPDRQRDTMRTWASNQAVSLLGEFFEAGVSGTVDGMDRPEFAAMIESIVCRRLNGENIAGIVVERMDRLARDLMVQEVLLKQCRENNIKVFAADRGDSIDIAADDGDPTRKLIRQVMGALSEWEKSQTVLKLRKARQAIKSKTGKCEGAKSYGEVDPKERVLLLTVRTLVTPETRAIDVARLLNREGFRTRHGNEFSELSAWRIMRTAGVPCTRKNPLLNFGDKRKIGQKNVGEMKG